MTLILVGTILLLSPFLLITNFKDKRIGFAYILSFVISLQLFTAIITQALHIFNYPIVLSINLFVFLTVVIIFLIKFFQAPKFTLPKIDWVLILVLIITSSSLISVHYNYSGEYTTVRLHQYAEHMQYAFPYYADEWYAVAFIKDAILSNSLPIKNPLAPPAWNKNFTNLEFSSHSFLAELILLLHLDPLTNYSYLSISSGVLICLLIYLFLRHNKVNKLSAGIITLSTLYITNGANLPGLWYLIPINLGIISMLISCFFFSTRNKKMLLIQAAITLIFYPPLIIFYIVAAISLILEIKQALVKKMRNTSYYMLPVLFAAVIVSLSYFFSQNTHPFLSFIFSKIIYNTFTPNIIPQYVIYNIIPIPILLLAIVGAIYLLVAKDKIWLLGMVGIGLIYWCLYFYSFFRFIIEWQRVIFFTSILVTIIAGYGLQSLLDALKKTNSFRYNNSLDYIQIGVLVLFLFLSFNYTDRKTWQKLIAVNTKTNEELMPEAPVSKYLQPDDIRLFKNINKQKFLSLPWKGTVIGVATGNYPFSTKPGTISINKYLPSEFMNADCDEKNKISKKRDIVYFYLPKFDCPNFRLIGTSSEGLYLYKVTQP